MPLRGSLFRKLKNLKSKRQKEESKMFKKEVKSEAKALKSLRTTRIKEEGRALLKQQIAMEKARIKAARGPTKIGRVEGFLQRQARKGLTAAQKEAKKRAARVRAGKPVFAVGPKKRKKNPKRKKRR